MDIKKQFVEVASPSVSNRGKVMQLDQLHDFISKMEDSREVYYSWYCFDANLKTHIEKTRTVQNYSGLANINQIILDFDKGSLEDKELLDLMRHFIAEELVNNYNIPDDYYTIWYSGTGFHVHLADVFGFQSGIDLPTTVKTTLAEIFPHADNIFDKPRLIRAGGTINNKSGFYKTFIDREDIFRYDMNDIKEMSSKRSDNFGLWFDEEIEIETMLSHLIKKPMRASVPINAKLHKIKGDPNAIVTCMQKAFLAGPIQGQRNETMMRIASWLRRNGTPQSIVENALHSYSGLDNESKTCTKQVFKEGYQYGCDDPIMSQWCSTKCIYYKRKDYSLNIKNAKQMETSFQDYIKQDFTDKSFDFGDIWQLPRQGQKYTVFPGELVIVLGDTGLGKTAFVQNLVAKLPNLSCLYLSLELHHHLMFRRFCQITHGMPKEEIIAEATNESSKSNFGREFKQISVLSDPIELSRLEKQIAEIKPKILVVDTTEDISVDNVYNDFERMNKIINTLKKIAITQDLIVIAVHHINKEGAKTGFTDITAAKGSMSVVQKADKVLAINGDRDKLTRYLVSQKSRDENKMKLQFEFQPKTFRWNQVQ